MQIIDDFLPKSDFEELQTIILSHRFPWFYIEDVSLPPEDRHFVKDDMAKETDGFYHILYDRPTNIESFAHVSLEKFYHKIEGMFGYTKKNLIRSRIGLKMPKVGFSKDNYNLPHVDYYFPHTTIIYYLNDSDGDTRMFQEFYSDSGIERSDFIVKELVKPKANRLLIFDGLQYHTASNPFDFSRRVVININFEKI